MTCRYSEVQKAVESNLRKQAQVLRGIDANMRSFGDLLQQSSQATEVSCAMMLVFAFDICTHFSSESCKQHPASSAWLVGQGAIVEAV